MTLNISHDARVVITGAGSGIGRATALECARRGAEVVAVDIDPATAAATAQACRRLGPAASDFACDVADGETVAALAQHVEAEIGPVDVLVSNAGVGLAGPFLDAGIEDWQWLRGVNIDGVAHGCHAFGRAMRARGRGHLVNIASMAGYSAQGSLVAYCTSKAAVIMFSQCLRADLAGSGVGVSAICPGVIDTPIPHHTRFVGSATRNRQRVIDGFRRGHDPKVVAEAVVEAVERDKELVPVGFEAHLAYRLLRFAPGPVRGLLARVSL